MRKCRYCGDVMLEINSRSGIRALEDICPKKECQEVSKSACSKMLPCGHSCKGFAGEKKCMPCLEEKCAAANPELMGQKGEDYCPICYVEALDAAPCLRSACGHIFHYRCIAKRVEIRWLGPRILFNFCACPLCKRWIQLAEENPLHKKMI
jgi:E3 ubiquitin-protein ligase MYCBP2